MAANNLGIGNFDPSKIETWPVLVRVVFGTFIMALIIAGSYFLVNQDQENELDAKEDTETSLRQQFDEKAKMAVNLEQYKDQLIKMRVNIAAKMYEYRDEKILFEGAGIDLRVYAHRTRRTRVFPPVVRRCAEGHNP